MNLFAVIRSRHQIREPLIAVVGAHNVVLHGKGCDPPVGELSQVQHVHHSLQLVKSFSLGQDSLRELRVFGVQGLELGVARAHEDNAFGVELLPEGQLRPGLLPC